MFVIAFAIEIDKYRIMSGKSWFFNRYIFALKDIDGLNQIAKSQFVLESFWVQFHDLPVRYMDRYYGNLIGSTLGNVLEINMEDDTGRRFLRVWIELNLSKPLARVRLLQIKGEIIRIPIQYERLCHFCFNC